MKHFRITTKVLSILYVQNSQPPVFTTSACLDPSLSPPFLSREPGNLSKGVKHKHYICL